MWSVVRCVSIVTLWLAAAISGPVFAQSQLDAAEVRTLIVGNTADVDPGEGIPFRAYFEPSGKWVQQRGGEILEGTWRINDDGSQCVTNSSGLSCGFIQKNGDGTYTRIVDGRAGFRWTKIHAGKAF